MKFRLRRHATRVLVGKTARSWLEQNELFDLRPTAVAVCSCGWQQAALHGEEAEQLAAEHVVKRVKML